LNEALKIEDDVKKKALERAKHEEIYKLKEYNELGNIHYKEDPQKYAMFKLAYY
jgi:hypothetical protein